MIEVLPTPWSPRNTSLNLDNGVAFLGVFGISLTGVSTVSKEGDGSRRERCVDYGTMRSAITLFKHK